MKAFGELYRNLDATTKTGAKLAALRSYFSVAPPADAAWALFFLSGRRIQRLIGVRKLSDWAMALADLPPWLFGECYDAVGDLGETVALLLGEPTNPHDPVAKAGLAEWIERFLLPLRDADEPTQQALVTHAWAVLDQHERFVWNKLITGAFRVGVAQGLVTRALAETGGLDVSVVAGRLMGDWQPSAEWYTALLAVDTADTDLSRPYPFMLAHPLEGEPDQLGAADEWQAEWKWDGIRAQVIRRNHETFVWSRGEELISERFPELLALGDYLPDGTVLDGEILPFREGVVLPFAQLQRRIGRKTLGKKLLQEVPVVLVTYDLLEAERSDLRDQPLVERRRRLESLVAQLQSAGATSVQLSALVPVADWEAVGVARDQARIERAEGLMLKRRSSPYRVGRVRGDWWKWKVDPYSVDAVLIYAQRGSGRRASLYSDYTFAVWDGDQLVPFAKAYSGLSDAEMRQVDAFVRRNTLESFGPVRTVKPELVFELAFEGIQRSTRHKSGIAVRFPRMLRWRHDKPASEADTLETVRALIDDLEVEE